MVPRLAAYLEGLPRPSAHQSAGPLADTAPPGGPLRKHVGKAGLIWRLGVLAVMHLAESGCILFSWACIGFGALSGRLDRGWLMAWALCLATALPLRLTGRWMEGIITIGFGGLLKERLLTGATQMDADVLRGQGVGELLGGILEAEAIERLGLTGGLDTFLAGLELLTVPFLLQWGAAASLEVALLAIWAIASVAVIAIHTRRREEWTGARLNLTRGMVEKMRAHRTRLSQQPSPEWHGEEDQEIDCYITKSEAFDRSTTRIEALIQRGYLIAAFAMLVPSFLAGVATVAQQAITFGATLYAASALERVGYGVSRWLAAWLAWRIVQPISEAAARPAVAGVAGEGKPTSSPVLQAKDLTFTHPGRVEPVLKDCSLTLQRGDHVILEGESGSGKSTLAALLTGLRKPASGVTLAGGLDLQTVGEEAWRRRIAAAPQYHENHILSASLSFNLLLGRPYPHSPEDVQDARELCLELGLGPLLERMPAGLDQFVGETGWQLSHGERSRVFLGRALLQRAEVVLLDESLAALDPENLHQCLHSVMRRAETLMVIAHP